MTTKTKKNVEALEKSLNSSNVVETLDQLEALISRVHKAQRIFATFLKKKLMLFLKQQQVQLIRLVFLLQEWLLKKPEWAF